MQSLYETLLIVTPDADDERVNAVIGDLRDIVVNDGGTVLQAGVWERRKLAYQVKGKSEGIYVLMYADGNNTLPAALKHRMKLDEAIVRSLVLRIEDPQETALREEIAKGDHSHDAAEIERQRIAAERRHEAEAAAAAMSLEEMVAAEEATAEEAVETTEEAVETAEEAVETADEASTAAPEQAGDEAVTADEPVQTVATEEPAADEAAAVSAITEPEVAAGPETEEAAPQPASGDEEEKEI